MLGAFWTEVLENLPFTWENRKFCLETRQMVHRIPFGSVGKRQKTSAVI